METIPCYEAISQFIASEVTVCLFSENEAIQSDPPQVDDSTADCGTCLQGGGLYMSDSLFK